MKKKLVVLLAVVMMFAFAATAYAVDFSDISEQPVTVQDAIAKTTALGIIEGYTDGTFGPEQNITRAEFAKIAVTAAGAKDTAAMLEKNASSFKDVKAGVWYTGWINASESLGIFQGDGNGNFRPNDSISNQEVVTVLMRLLGYNDNLTGTWPTNYITQANKVGILDDVAIVASAAAKRADVVVMLDDALDTEIVTYDKDTNEFVMKQNKVADSDAKTLLEDSFDGTFFEYAEFAKVDQVRDAAAKTLTWNVGEKKYDDDKIPYDALIIDKDTKVSHNAASLFDLEGHQGKVYFVKDGNKYYARFIEVKSYTKTVTDTPEADNGKVKVGKTNYNAVKNPTMPTKDKNTNFVLYFNDNDQVYLAKADDEFTEKAYYVKSVGNSTVKLVGNKNVTASMKDGETLIWDGDEFIAPSELKVGDAIMEITENELYTKVAEVAGEMTKITSEGKKATIGGKTYKFDAKYFDDKFEDANLANDEVLGTNVKYILNKNNVIAAILVDESTTGNKLYGIVVDGAQSGTSWANKLSGVTIFTAEGKEVTYDLDLDKDLLAKDCLGRLVEYQLNKDGEIDKWNVVNGETDGYGIKLSDGNDVKIKNNTYLQGKDEKTVTLSANAVIFEVSLDSKNYIDPSIVTRSQLLGGGDFTPSTLGKNEEGKKVKGLEDGVINAYAVYVANSNGAAKALAYTDANSSKYNFAVVASYNFSDADGDNNVTFTGDDNVYELLTKNNELTYKGGKPYDAGDDALIIYTLSGSKIDVKMAYAKKTGIEGLTREVSGYNDGLMIFKTNMNVWDAANGHTGNTNNEKQYPEIMTDDDTVVYVMNSSTGKYELGGLDDIYKEARVFVPLVDKDDIADLVIVDEYTPYDETYTVTLTTTEEVDKLKGEISLEYGDAKGTSIKGVKYADNVTLNVASDLTTQVTVKVNGTDLKEVKETNPITIKKNTTISVTKKS